MPSRTTKVGLIGLGKMGAPMARHLLDAGYEVHGFDVDRVAVARAGDTGLTAQASPRAVAAASDVTLVVVGFDDQVLSVCLGQPDGLLTGAERGDTIVLCSTIRPSTSLAVGAAAEPAGVGVVDATLSRAEHAAIDGKLLALVGGPELQVKRIEPVLRTFATDIVRLGELGAGQVGKMLNNLLLWAAVSINAEALTIGMRLGLDQESLRQALLLGSGANWALETWHKARPMPWAEKDMAIVMDYADEVALAAPVAAVVREAMKALKQQKAGSWHDGDGVSASMLAFLEAVEATAPGRPRAGT